MLDAEELARQALSGKRYAVARIVTLCEDTRPVMAATRDAVIAELELAAAQHGHTSCVLGVTGTPGAGKSSLLAKLAGRLPDLDRDLRMAIVAVDPSSPTSGGALLGDRTRMNLAPAQDRVFFRSQASATALGGLAPYTFHVAHALSLLFDVVLVETVGVGQSEADIRHLADRVYLVIAPLGGDEIQYLKAGIIEVPDVFIVNKSDEEAAKSTYHQLRASLWLARPEDSDLPVFRTSARTGLGIDDLAGAMLADIAATTSQVADKASHFFRAWVQQEWGRHGLRALRAQGGPEVVLAAYDGFGAAQQAFESSVRAGLAG